MALENESCASDLENHRPERASGIACQRMTDERFDAPLNSFPYSSPQDGTLPACRSKNYVSVLIDAPPPGIYDEKKYRSSATGGRLTEPELRNVLAARIEGEP